MPLSGINYYRLRQVDFDGVFTYHQVIAVDMGRDSHLPDIHLYPNPAGNKLFLEGMRTSEIRNYRIFDSAGRLIRDTGPAASILTLKRFGNPNPLQVQYILT